MSELVLPLTAENGETPKYRNGDDACQFGIQPANDLPILFGDTFLRSAYAVYDLINNKIALANTDFNATDSNIVPFASQGAAIPSAGTAANTGSVSATATGLPRVDNSATAVPTASFTSGTTSASGLSAHPGFVQDGASSSSSSTSSSASSKKSAGNTVLAFDWAMIGVLVGSFTMMVMGGGFFVTM